MVYLKSLEKKKQLKNYQMNKFQQDGLNVKYISIKIK